MRLIRLGLPIVAVLAWLPSPPLQADEVEGFHATVTPYAGKVFWAQNLGLEEKLLSGFRFGLMWNPHIGLEGTWGVSSTSTDSIPQYSVDITNWNVDVIYNLMPRQKLNPFLVAGWTQLNYSSVEANPRGADGKYNGYEIGGGLKWAMGDPGGPIALRLDVRDLVTRMSPAFPGYDQTEHNLLFSLGFQFALGGVRKDSDGDGVWDRDDLCPDTPFGAIVAADGCPQDSDGDGVFDGLDDCPDTPPGADVDAAGCPRDRDSDGVLDGLDACPDTPPGVVVDSAGCPLDSDGDGVYNGLDTCPDTPAGAVVDASGCAHDSDGDGVLDGLDACPGTPSHLQVDARGCPASLTALEFQLLDTGLIRSSEVRFRSGSAELEEESYPILDEIGVTLANWPQLRIEIGGHTDAQGAASFNQGLSEQRAHAVLEYLVARMPDLEVENFKVVGYGEDQPLASNRTRAGRTQNRRVEFKVLNPEEIEKISESQKIRDNR
jgi:outer membrane protein OmpA-like peptidoglycan-associated protein